MYYFRMKNFAAAVLFVSIVWSCSPNSFRASNKIYKKQAKEYAKLLMKYPLSDTAITAGDWVGTTNFTMRRPNFVILHHTAQNSCDQTLRTFTLKSTQVSAHYVICRDGIVYHMLNDMFRAHHAGISKWGNNSDLNSSSIGIEVDNNGSEPFNEAQINSLLELLGRLKRAYNIPDANFIGHADAAPGRKIDPSRYFPWKLLAEKGYGVWYDTANVKVSPDFNSQQALRLIGYNVKDSIAAIQSFKIHFVPGDTANVITDQDKKILTDLIRRYQ